MRARDERQQRPLRGQAPSSGVAAVIVLLLAAACGAPAPVERVTPPPGKGPVLVLGVDGLEWDVLLPLLAEGRLPNLAALMREGVYGELATLRPTYSPVLWTTIATGKRHEKHGIHHFAQRTAAGELRLYQRTDRRTKAIWNILADAGREVAVVGWWMTYPVERVPGLMVAQTNTLDQVRTEGGRQIWKGGLRSGYPQQVHPAERQAEMLTVLAAVEAEMPRLEVEIFGRSPHPLSPVAQRLWQNCRWAFRADATYLRIVLEHVAADPPDLTLLYLGGPDVVGHRFWRYMEPERYRHPPAPEEVESLGGVIPSYYEYVDAALGRLRAAYGPEIDVLVVSDHGMAATGLDASFDPGDPPADVNSGDHQDAPAGVLIAAGPSFRKAATAILPSRRAELGIVGNVLDITPTLLALFGIPLGRDMDGGPLLSLLRPDLGIAGEVATHDTPEFLDAVRRGAWSRDEAERLDQLRSLGYLGD